MAYADGKTDFNRIITWGYNMRAAIIATMLANADSIKSNLTNYHANTAQAILQNIRDARFKLEALKADVRSALEGSGLVRIMQEIGSPALISGAILDPAYAFRTWREYQFSGGVDEKLQTPRAVSFAADPAEANGLRYYRLTVDELGQKIEAGKHNQVKTAEVTQSVINGAGAGQAVSVIYGATGGFDELDYQKGSGRDDVELRQNSEVNFGIARNAAILVGGTTANGTVITDDTLGQWDLTKGSNTVVVRTGTPGTFRTKSYGMAIGPHADPVIVSQSMIGLDEDLRKPVLPTASFYWDATWEGNITFDWGSQQQVMSHADFVAGAGLKHLTVTRDKKLYPVNFDNGAPLLKLTMDQTNGSGELVLHYFDALASVKHQGIHYFSGPSTSLAAVGVKKTWTDTCTFAAKIQDMIAWAFDEAEYAYLNTTGTNNYVDP